jgi:hypothetical protein
MYIKIPGGWSTSYFGLCLFEENLHYIARRRVNQVPRFPLYLDSIYSKDCLYMQGV